MSFDVRQVVDAAYGRLLRDAQRDLAELETETSDGNRDPVKWSYLRAKVENLQALLSCTDEERERLAGQLSASMRQYADKLHAQLLLDDLDDETRADPGK